MIKLSNHHGDRRREPPHQNDRPHQPAISTSITAPYPLPSIKLIRQRSLNGGKKKHAHNGEHSKTKKSTISSTKIMSVKNRKNTTNNINHANPSRLAPYNPTHETATEKALDILDLTSLDVFFDLGCGDGRLILAAMERYYDDEYLMMEHQGLYRHDCDHHHHHPHLYQGGHRGSNRHHERNESELQDLHYGGAHARMYSLDSSMPSMPHLMRSTSHDSQYDDDDDETLLRVVQEGLQQHQYAQLQQPHNGYHDHDYCDHGNSGHNGHPPPPPHFDDVTPPPLLPRDIVTPQSTPSMPVTPLICNRKSVKQMRQLKTPYMENVWNGEKGGIVDETTDLIPPRLKLTHTVSTEESESIIDIPSNITASFSNEERSQCSNQSDHSQRSPFTERQMQQPPQQQQQQQKDALRNQKSRQNEEKEEIVPTHEFRDTLTTLSSFRSQQQDSFNCKKKLNEPGLRCVGIEYNQAYADVAKRNIETALCMHSHEWLERRVCIRWGDVLDEWDRGDADYNSDDDEDALNGLNESGEIHLEEEEVGVEVGYGPKLRRNVRKASRLTLLNDATAVFVYLLPDGLEKVKPLLKEAATRRREQQRLSSERNEQRRQQKLADLANSANLARAQTRQQQREAYVERRLSSLEEDAPGEFTPMHLAVPNGHHRKSDTVITYSHISEITDVDFHEDHRSRHHVHFSALDSFDFDVEDEGVERAEKEQEPLVRFDSASSGDDENECGYFLEPYIPPFRVVSYMFSIPGWTYAKVDTSSKGGCPLYLYEDIDTLD